MATKKETAPETLSAIPPAGGIDWPAIEARLKKARAEAAERLKETRTNLLADLCARGVEEVEAQYDGYGDSGNVNSVAVRPKLVDIGDIEARLMDFVWDVAYGLHPGFEINEGGEGTLTWNVTEDRIDVDHASFYTERDEYLHEDI